jgi:hypothetical protein
MDQGHVDPKQEITIAVRLNKTNQNAVVKRRLRYFRRRYGTQKRNPFQSALRNQLSSHENWLMLVPTAKFDAD